MKFRSQFTCHHTARFSRNPWPKSWVGLLAIHVISNGNWFYGGCIWSRGKVIGSLYLSADPPFILSTPMKPSPSQYKRLPACSWGWGNWLSSSQLKQKADQLPHGLLNIERSVFEWFYTHSHTTALWTTGFNQPYSEVHDGPLAFTDCLLYAEKIG